MMLEKIISWIKNNLSKKEDAYFMHELLELESPESMLETYILRNQGRRYLIINTDFAEPVLFGRIAGKIRRKSFYYTSKIILAKKMPYSEQAEINNILSKLWSDDNLFEIMKRSGYKR